MLSYGINTILRFRYIKIEIINNNINNINNIGVHIV